MIFRYFIFTLCLIIPVSGESSPINKKNNTPRRYLKEGEIILNYKKDIESGRLETIVNELETEIVYRSHYANFVTVKFDKGRDMWQLIKKFESYSDIMFAEPNGIAYVMWTPDDPHFELYQWNFNANHINMPLAWDIERGGNSSVIVSILDTGIAYEDYEIPYYELSEVSSQDGFYHQSPDLTITNFVTGYDFINDDSHPNDQNGHGTHVCGTVAQSTNNAKGVAGMAFNVSIMPVQVLNYRGLGECDIIADGIHYAYQNGADILSLSLGGEAGDSTGFSTVHQAIIDANNAGALVIAAAGNEGIGKLSYPAGFEECIAVGATDIDNNLAPYSQWGNGIDIVAPGGDIYDTIPGTGYPATILQSTYYHINDGYYLATVDSFCYMFLPGTSMAAPHVSALAALLISHGITTPSAIKSAIYSTATDLGTSGYDIYFGYGLINPPLALGAELLFTSMPILQNPYNQQYIDIWIVSQRPIINDLPDTCRITLAGETYYRNFQKVDEQTYRTDFLFDTSGIASIYVTARDTSGTKGTYTRNFTVTKVIGSSGGFAESEDENFRLTIPDCTDGRTYWIVIVEEEKEFSSSSYIPISKIYKCGPQGKRISVSSIVRFSFDKKILEENNAVDIGIYKENGEEFEYVDTDIDIINGNAYASVQEFGSYVLILLPGNGKSSVLNTNKLVLDCYPIPTSRKLFYNYAVPFASFIDIAIYDVSGRKVKSIRESVYTDYGLYTGLCQLDDKKLSSGVYFMKISISNGNSRYEESKKIILMK